MLAQIRTLVANREYSDIGAWPWIYVRVKVPPASELRSDNDITGSLLTAIISTTVGGGVRLLVVRQKETLEMGNLKFKYPFFS